MRKVLFGALALFAAVVVLRRFGPTLSKRAMAKCQEMMGGAPEEHGFEEERTQLASSIAR
jgi:hypothetical protein